MKKRNIYSIALLITLFSSVCFSQDILTQEKYLEQVRKNNPELKSTNLAIDSMGKKILETDMVYSPILSANYTWLDDKSGSGFGSTLLINENVTNSWTIGLNKKFKTGSLISVGYTNSESALDLSSPYSIGTYSLLNFTGYEIKPFAKVEQSLLRDFGSRLTDAGINKAKAQVRAGQYMQILKMQQAILRAKTVHVNLTLAREIINFRKEELNRAEKILKWNENRFNLNLAEKSDMLQAEALYKSRKLSLQMATEDEKNVCRDFNELRGVSGNAVLENLGNFSDTVGFYSSMSSLTVSGRRADLLSAQESSNSSKFASIEALYKSYPEISMFGQLSLHGLDLTYSNALDQVTQLDKPAYTVGLNLNVPLDFSTLKKVKKGYDLDYQSAKEMLNKTEITVKNDWDKLMDTWNNVKTRLALAQDIEKIQKDRMANEQFKLERGKTTMYQLMSAENDLDDTTINVYRLKFEEYVTYIQVELYNTNILP